MHDQAAGQRVEQRLGVRAHVAANHHLFAAEEGKNRAADLEGEVVGQGFAVDAADVVCLEDACHDLLL